MTTLILADACELMQMQRMANETQVDATEGGEYFIYLDL